MIRLALALALLATPAEAATAVDRMHCWAYPHHDRCKPPAPAQPPPAAPAEPVQAPVAPPPPVLAPTAPAPQASPEPLQAPLPTIAPVQLPATPAPPVAAPALPRAAPARAAPRPMKKAKPAKVKKRAAPPAKAKRARIGNWCDRIPKGTSMSTVEFWAPTFGVKMTPRNRALAQACINSKT